MIEKKELAEFEEYFRSQEAAAGENHPQITLLAGIGILLAHLVETTFPKEEIEHEAHADA